MVRQTAPTARSSGTIISFALAILLATMAMVPAFGGFTGRSVLAQSAAVEDKTATVTPADALVYASVNLDTKSAQFTLAKDLIDRAGLMQEIDSATSSASQQEQATIDAVTGGYAAFVLTKLPAEFAGSLDTLTTEVSSAASNPSGLAAGGVPSGFAVILQASDPDAVEKTLLDDLKNTDATQKVVTDTYEGVTISSVAAMSSQDTGTAVARVGDFIVIATVPEDIHPIIDTHSGKADPLSGSAEYTSLKGELNAEWLTFGLVNGPRMLDAIDASAMASTEIPASTKAQLQAVTGFVFWADQPGFRMDTISMASGTAATPVATPQVRGDLADKVPADSLVFTNGMNINQYGVLDAIGLIFAQALISSETNTGLATPVSVTDQQAAIYAQAASVLGFNLKTDFIDQLDGEYGFALSASNLTSGNPKIDALFVTDTVNAQKVTDVASKISFILAAAIDGEKISSRDVGGSTVTTLDLGDPSMPLKVEYGVVNGQLLVGVNDGIDTYITGPAQPLATSPLYTDTLAQLPGDPTGITFVNLEQIVPLLAEAGSAYGGAMPTDASPECAKFASQSEAQAAYDEDSFTNFDLDQNFNGKACEDFFAAATPEASPAAAPMSGLRAVGSVTYQKDGHQATSTIILIAEK